MRSAIATSAPGRNPRRGLVLHRGLVPFRRRLRDAVAEGDVELQCRLPPSPVTLFIIKGGGEKASKPVCKHVFAHTRSLCSCMSFTPCLQPSFSRLQFCQNGAGCGKWSHCSSCKSAPERRQWQSRNPMGVFRSKTSRQRGQGGAFLWLATAAWTLLRLERKRSKESGGATSKTPTIK